MYCPSPDCPSPLMIGPLRQASPQSMRAPAGSHRSRVIIALSACQRRASRIVKLNILELTSTLTVYCLQTGLCCHPLFKRTSQLELLARACTARVFFMRRTMAYIAVFQFCGETRSCLSRLPYVRCLVLSARRKQKSHTYALSDSQIKS